MRSSLSTLRSSSVSPAAEIIARPRIVPGQEVKQIQVKGGQTPRLGVGNNSLPLAAGAARAPLKSPPKRISPSERNLTPSRRGADLILSVDSM
jgi:hypothetical protein